MDQHYTETHYVQDLDSLIKSHELRLIDVAAEQHSAQAFEPKIKEECDSFAEDIKKIDADENAESDETLMQKRKELCEKLIFTWGKLKWFREKIAECESRKQQITGELHKLYMQRLHVSVVHNK